MLISLNSCYFGKKLYLSFFAFATFIVIPFFSLNPTLIVSPCSISAFIILFTLKKLIGLRVSELEELEGLDIHEHGMSAYPDFRMNDH